MKASDSRASSRAVLGRQRATCSGLCSVTTEELVSALIFPGCSRRLRLVVTTKIRRGNWANLGDFGLLDLRYIYYCSSSSLVHSFNSLLFVISRDKEFSPRNYCRIIQIFNYQLSKLKFGKKFVAMHGITTSGGHNNNNKIIQSIVGTSQRVALSIRNFFSSRYSSISI